MVISQCTMKGHLRRQARDTRTMPSRPTNGQESAAASSTGYSGDSYAKLCRSKNRGKAPPQLMDEIGCESCGWVSAERKRSPRPEAFQSWAAPAELRAPCCSPAEHLMSQCNHQHLKLECSQSREGIAKQAGRCLLGPSQRCNRQLENQLAAKCFDYNRTSDYLTWIDRHLQR